MSRYDDDGSLVLTCHEATISSSGRVLALPKLVHRCWEKSRGARGRDVEIAAGTVERGLIHLGIGARVRKAALPRNAGASLKGAIIEIRHGHA